MPLRNVFIVARITIKFAQLLSFERSLNYYLERLTTKTLPVWNYHKTSSILSILSPSHKWHSLVSQSSLAILISQNHQPAFSCWNNIILVHCRVTRFAHSNSNSMFERTLASVERRTKLRSLKLSLLPGTISCSSSYLHTHMDRLFWKWCKSIFLKKWDIR